MSVMKKTRTKNGRWNTAVAQDSASIVTGVWARQSIITLCIRLPPTPPSPCVYKPLLLHPF
jgi:hypothetical protein